jgi:tRNA(fMet)-specific endonuclease VapC
LIPCLVLDTHALSAAEDGNPDIIVVATNVRQWALPVVVLGEFRYGISQSRNVVEYRKSLDALIADCLLFEITNATTHYYAEVRLDLKRIGRPIPVNDVWIAALCRQHELPILSRDQHFDVVPRIKRLTW